MVTPGVLFVWGLKEGQTTFVWWSTNRAMFADVRRYVDLRRQLNLPNLAAVPAEEWTSWIDHPVAQQPSYPMSSPYLEVPCEEAWCAHYGVNREFW